MYLICLANAFYLSLFFALVLLVPVETIHFNMCVITHRIQVRRLMRLILIRVRNGSVSVTPLESVFLSSLVAGCRADELAL